ncbi:type VII secretion system-associated protein [Streptomyces sp. NPDC056707]|uniref:type VII secretion system-associated protein n=1 Tax=Streptomyces sp. NPDC056707 TaxID=3345919 RepID=UPI0036C15CA9
MSTDERPTADGETQEQAATAAPSGTGDIESMSSSPVESPAEEGIPPVPDHIKEAARLAPDHWIGMVDPMWSGEGLPPQWAVAGSWRSGQTGEIEEWQENEEYRPSPEVLGLAAPTDAVDAAVQLAATGYGPAEDVPRLLAAAEVAVLTGPDGRPLTAATSDGQPVIAVFTASDHLRAAGPLASTVMSIPALVGQLPDGHRLYLNPTASIGMLMETEPLLQAIADEGREAASSATV